MLNSFLNNNFFRLNFPKIKDTTLYIQKTSIPSVSLTHSQIGTPFSMMKEPDTRLRFEDFSCQFKLDEEFNSYLAIYEWMEGLGFPESFDQYASLGRENSIVDASLIVHNSSGNPKVEVQFRNIFPIFLGEINFDLVVTDAENVMIPVTFAYDYFKIKKI